MNARQKMKEGERAVGNGALRCVSRVLCLLSENVERTGSMLVHMIPYRAQRAIRNKRKNDARQTNRTHLLVLFSILNVSEIELLIISEPLEGSSS